jgi:hypothetical protein
MSSVVGWNLVGVRVTYVVTPGLRTITIGREGSVIGFHATAPRPPVERVSGVALEWRRQPGSEQPRPRDGPLPVSVAERVGGLHGAAAPGLGRFEQ